jgi:hypothetical protein
LAYRPLEDAIYLTERDAGVAPHPPVREPKLRSDRPRTTVDRVLALQRSAGNAAVAALLARRPRAGPAARPARARTAALLRVPGRAAWHLHGPAPSVRAGLVATSPLLQRCGCAGCEGCGPRREDEEEELERARARSLQRTPATPTLARAALPDLSEFASLRGAVAPGREALTAARRKAGALRSDPARLGITKLAGVGPAKVASVPDAVKATKEAAPKLGSLPPAGFGVPAAPKPPPGPAKGVLDKFKAPPAPTPAAADGAGAHEAEHDGGCDSGDCACSKRDKAAAPKAGDAAPWEAIPEPAAPPTPAPPSADAALGQVRAQSGGDPQLPGIAQAAGAGDKVTTLEAERAATPFTAADVRKELSALLAGTKVQPLDPEAVKGKPGETVDRCSVVRAHVEASAAGLRKQGFGLLAARRGSLLQHKAGREGALKAEFAGRRGRAQSASEGAKAKTQADAARKQRQEETKAEGQKQAADRKASADSERLQAQGDAEAGRVVEETNTAVEAKTGEADREADSEVEGGKREAATHEAEARRQSSGNLLDRALDAARSAVRGLVNRARAALSAAKKRAKAIIDRARTWVSKKLAAMRRRLSNLWQRIKNGIRRAVNWARDLIKRIGAALKRFVAWLWKKVKQIFWAIVRFIHSVLAWLVMALLVVLCFVALGILGILHKLAGYVPWFGKAIQAWLKEKIDDLIGFIDRVVNLLGDPFTKNFDDCTPDQIAALTPAVPNAAARAGAAASKLGDVATMTPATKTAFTTEFVRGGGTITQPMVDRAKSVLGATAAGLRSEPVDFRCDTADEPACDTALAYTFHQKLAPFISVHVCPDAFTRGTPDLENTILHEGTHKYGSTDDKAYGGSRLGLSSEDALNNAASYEHFAASV